MHIARRSTVVLAMMIVLVPLAAGLRLAGDLRNDAKEQFDRVLEEAKDSHREAATYSEAELSNQRQVKDLKKKLLELGKKKHDIRMKMVEVKNSIADLDEETRKAVEHEVDIAKASFRSQQRLEEFVRLTYISNAITQEEGSSLPRLVIRRLAGRSLGDRMESLVHGRAMVAAREDFENRLRTVNEGLVLTRNRLHGAAADAATELSSLMKVHEAIAAEYRATDKLLARAEKEAEANEERLREIRETTAEVQREILRMQGELARIDGRLRSQAERKLVQLGLKEDSPDRFKPFGDGAGLFSWPAQARISAGFHDASYQRFFGVAHNGIDIVIPQGSDVRSASDGIVFLARDGGARGFSYILIGHRDGYATLYGHLSSFSVQTGDVVSRGQVIGLSGGAPGTHGAGPMTTAAHLHFEMMKNGVHIDPRDLLP